MPSVLNLRTDVLLRSEETGGHVSVTEIAVPRHSAGPRCPRMTSTLSLAPRKRSPHAANHSDCPRATR